MGGYQQPTNQEAANNGDTSWLSLFSGLGVGGGVDQSASTSGDIQGPSAPGPTTQQINAYITLYGQQEPLKSSANPGALARQALMSDPNTLKEVNDSIAELARVRARTGTDAGSGNAIEVEKLRNEFLYANMQQTAENERLTRESTAAQSALTRGDTRAQADQVAAHNREQLILDWHKSQLMAEDNARTAAETAQRDKQSAFLGLLPYGHAPGFNVGTYRQGQSLPEYTVTAPAWVDPSIQNTQIAQPNIPAITWPGGPSGPGPSGPGGY